MMSPSDEERIIAMVDSFTKTVARNFSRNLKRAKANREKHFSDEPIDYLLELLSHDDGYPSDHFVLYADELSCVVHSETLYKALCSLPEKQRKVLLFDFWYHSRGRGHHHAAFPVYLGELQRYCDFRLEWD